MKKIPFLILALIITSFFVSCKKENNDNVKVSGKIVFNYTTIVDGVKKAARQNPNDSASAPYSIIISITDNAGNLVYNLEQIPLYNMNGNYISKPISLEVGNYKLSDFLVVDANGNVLYLTPKVGSSLAYLVSNPLPIDFSVNKDEVTKVEVEVLENNGGTPEDYGYTTFSFNIVDIFNFYVSVFVYNDTTNNFMLTTSRINIAKDNSIILSTALSATTSIIPLRNEEGNYVLTITKDGYQIYTSDLNLYELQGYNKDNPLVVILQKAENNIITNGLIAYYPFNGNTKDASQNQLDAYCNASLTNDRFGNANSAYHFNGIDQYIDFPNNSLLKPQFPFSISCWFKIESYSPSNQLLTTDYALDVYTGSWFTITIYGNPTISIGNGNYISINSRYGKKGSSVIQVSQWYHMVGVYNNASDIQLYINGVNDGGTYEGYASNLIYSSNPGTIGRKDCGNSTQAPYFFNGSIDEVAFYNRALSQSEVTTLYNCK